LATTLFAVRFATRRCGDFLALDLADRARLRATDLRVRDLLAERFATARFAAFFAADFFFAAIIHLQ
jgi:hypothetical protein